MRWAAMSAQNVQPERVWAEGWPGLDLRTFVQRTWSELGTWRTRGGPVPTGKRCTALARSTAALRQVRLGGSVTAQSQSQMV